MTAASLYKLLLDEYYRLVGGVDYLLVLGIKSSARLCDNIYTQCSYKSVDSERDWGSNNI